MASERRTLMLARRGLVAILAVVLLTPALALLLLVDWDDLRRHGWPLLLAYLLIILGVTYSYGGMLYSLALRPASPARHTLDRLLAGFCVVDSGLTYLSASHPHVAAIASQFLTFTILAVALSLCGLYWPLGVQPPQHPARRWRLPRWLRRSVALLFAVAPLPLAIWLTHIDWLHTARGSIDDHLPQIVSLSLLFAMGVGVHWNDRINVQPSWVAPLGPAAVPVVEGPVMVAQGAASVESPQSPPDMEVGMRGVLVSRTCATRLLEMNGDLWLFSDGLLRIPLGWRKTLTYVGYFYDPHRPVVRTFDTGDFLHATTDPRNVWIARNDIVSARLRRGIVYGELRATLYDGHLRRVMWEQSSATYLFLRTALKEWLGERLDDRSKVYEEAATRPSG